MVADLKAGGSPAVEDAPYKATYVLYHWRTPPEGPVPENWTAEDEVERLYLRGLSRKDKVGFERDDKGQLFAVAGDEKIPLADGRYCWHITPETEYRGTERILHETGEIIVDIATLPFAVVGAVVTVATISVAGVCGLWLWCTT
jgi:hypothetical protein